jgi:ABC-type antimicrobial peptide transport system permease subunit
VAVAVARRTREIGIRLALGATPRHVLRSVFARAGRQLGGGIIAGNSIILLLAWRADSLTADLLATSVITSVIMAAVGVLACAAPARRALRVQPTEALRQVTCFWGPPRSRVVLGIHCSGDRVNTLEPAP